MTDFPSKTTDWNAALNHPIPISANSWQLPEAAEAQVITLPIRVKPLPVQSYFFNVVPSSKKGRNNTAARAFLSSGPKQANEKKPAKRASGKRERGLNHLVMSSS